MKTTTTIAGRLAVSAAALLLALTGCAGAGSGPDDTATTAPAADALSVTDSWVKAADTGMSAAFGVLENSGRTDVIVVSAESPAAGMLELHETVVNDTGEMVMQRKENGFVVPADGSLELAPGGNHIMLMALTGPIKAGDEVTVTLTLSDGSTVDFTAAAKDFSGANETYPGDMKTGAEE
ncbi:copper chaperone PCu(A)C [Cryobacterium sp. PH31-AA6]|uniref:copper chaperone PCu(A)C n=1 Tax=Cryobacterium sp. PH31-AA6 TaxID=3046205 RepID=UPI0024BA1507|nr:copper chaperone PCu(A)C [Cryobacterium sp. PH31-AA6]MDJ0324764.1 copper chaperone PCu(A)C [Cryobacterium sp. PH31-AA6]